MNQSEKPEENQEEKPEEKQEEKFEKNQEEKPEENQEEKPEENQEEKPEENQEEKPEENQEEKPEEKKAETDNKEEEISADIKQIENEKKHLIEQEDALDTVNIVEENIHKIETDNLAMADNNTPQVPKVCFLVYFVL